MKKMKKNRIHSSNLGAILLGRARSSRAYGKLFFIFSFFHFFIFISCGGKPTLADVAEDDSLCIDTVATLEEVAVPDTVAPADSVEADSL